MKPFSVSLTHLPTVAGGGVWLPSHTCVDPHQLISISGREVNEPGFVARYVYARACPFVVTHLRSICCLYEMPKVIHTIDMVYGFSLN